MFEIPFSGSLTRGRQGMHLSSFLYEVRQCGSRRFVGGRCGQEEYFLTSPEMNTFRTNTLLRA